MTGANPSFISRGEGQTFFIGPALFLRPVEPDDAVSAPVWSSNPFPRPVEVMRERIQTALGDDPDPESESQRMLICRRADDRPLGSVLFDYDNGRECTLWFSHDPNRSLDEHAAIESEVMSFTLPWLIEKRNLMKVYTEHMGQHPLVAETATRLGMRLGYRLREAFLHEHRRYDRIGYELLSSDWIVTLGMPRGIEEGPIDREIRSPAPLRWNTPGEAPVAAIVTGERLSLRPFEPDDGKLVAKWLMQETEDSHPGGPDVVNPWTYGRHFVALAQESPPTWPRFAIVRNDDGQLIGANGLTNLDLLHRTAETETTLYLPGFRNQGYGTEAKHLLLEYAFQRIGLHMVYSWVSEFNARSAAALIKQGYREAGYFAWAEPYKGHFTGAWYFDYLADEWRAARR